MSSAHRFSIVGLGTLHLCLATNLPAQAPDAQRFVPLPAPTLIIGREDDPDHEFLGISAAHRLPNGEFAIADRLPAVRLFDAGGRLVRTLGREGEGPGEFRRVTGLFQAGDTLTVFDSNLQRLTRYLASSTLLGTQPLRISESVSVHVVGQLARGRWVVATRSSRTGCSLCCATSTMSRGSVLCDGQHPDSPACPFRLACRVGGRGIA